MAADGYLVDCDLVYFETQVCVAVRATTDDCIVSVSCVADELFYEDMADEFFASLGRADYFFSHITNSAEACAFASLWNKKQDSDGTYIFGGKQKTNYAQHITLAPNWLPVS